jgi:hypothetical protein
MESFAASKGQPRSTPSAVKEPGCGRLVSEARAKLDPLAPRANSSKRLSRIAASPR